MYVDLGLEISNKVFTVECSQFCEHSAAAVSLATTDPGLRDSRQPPYWCPSIHAHYPLSYLFNIPNSECIQRTAEAVEDPEVPFQTPVEKDDA